MEGISRIALEGISPVDVAQMIRSQNPETSPPPQFTNPFFPATNSPFTVLCAPTAKPYSSSFITKSHLESGSPFDTGGTNPAFLEEIKFANPLQSLPHHETLIEQLFPRMSMEGGAEADVYHTKNDDPGLNRFCLSGQTRI